MNRHAQGFRRTVAGWYLLESAATEILAESNVCLALPPLPGWGKGVSKSAAVLIGELSQRIGRSSDTVKRWEELGLITPSRDTRGRRLYSEADVPRCLELAELGLLAMMQSKKLAQLAQAEVPQLAFDFSDAKQIDAA